MNIIQIAGHLGADPESRFTASGQKVITLRVAVNSRRGGKDETTWYRVTIWGDRFEKMMPYLKKGSGVIVVGSLHKPEIYTDKEGRPQVSLEITAEMLHFNPFGKSDRQEGQGAGQGQYSDSHGQNPQGYRQQPAPAHTPSAGQDFDYGGGSGYRFDQYGGGAGSNAGNEEEMPF